MNGFFGAIGAAVDTFKSHLEHTAGDVEGTARSVIESRHEHFENFSNAAIGTYNHLKPHAEHAASVIESTARSVIESQHKHFEDLNNAAAGTVNNLKPHLSCTMDFIITNASAAMELGQRHLSTFDSAAAIQDIKTKLQLNELKAENLTAAALTYAQENPGQVAMCTVAPLTLIFPSLAWGPVLQLLGLSAGGPVAGGIFASLQSQFGTPMAMRRFQSAAMGGAGGLVMDGVTRGVVAIGAIVAERLNAAKENCDQ